MLGSWHAHPGAVDAHVELRPVESGRVTGLGAVCDLRPHAADDDARSASFSVSEFVTLQGSRRVILHKDRGFTISWRSSGGESSYGEIRNHETAQSITRNVLNVVRPDDDECHDDHPWSWLAELARARGLDVTAEDLRGLPYEVILTDKVKRSFSPTR